MLSERYPMLYGPSVAAHRSARRLHWMFERAAPSRSDGTFEAGFRVASHRSILLRQLGDVDMDLQRNKVTNLRLALATIEGRVLRPGQELSFWRCVGEPNARRGYLPGLVLVHGRMASSAGGGLCQLSNLLHWLVLHSPLRVAEHHHHGYDPFPDSGRQVPFGSGATVFYNYVDLKFDNPTLANYKIHLWLTDTELRGEIWADRLPPVSYHVHEEGHRFFMRNGQIYRENMLWRTAHDRATGNQVARELISHNVFPVLYRPDPNVVIEPETLH